MSIDRGDTETIRQAVDRDRLVSTASDLVAIKSPTGHEEEAASYLAGVFHDLGLETTLQPVEEGRANAVGRHAGTGEGPSLMFNGHLDTSYSGDEAWLHGRGFKPSPLVEGDAIWGLGIMNMKGAIACYVEAVRALLDSGVTLEGDVVIAAVAGEIEKTQWGDEYRGKDFRGYGTGTRHLVTHGVLTDACVLGEPTEERIVLGHFGTMWARISTKGPFFHTAFSAGRLEENSIMRMQEVIGALRPWIADWEQTATYQGRYGIVNEPRDRRISSSTFGFLPPCRCSRRRVPSVSSPGICSSSSPISASTPRYLSPRLAPRSPPIIRL